MRVSCAADMKAMDAWAIEKMGVPSDALMEAAALGTVRIVCEKFSPSGTVTVFCGSGNNGGDGIAAARFLLERGLPVRCFLTGSPEKMTADARLMRQRLEAAGGRLEPFEKETAAAALKESCLQIDAMFGIGLNSALRGAAAEAAALMNCSGLPTAACDIPSGVLADTGAVPGIAVRADITVTYSQSKPGLYMEPGLLMAGDVIPIDIGVPEEAQNRRPHAALLTDHALVQKLLPVRRRTAHKGDFGKLLLLCGSRGMTGAASMAAKAALRTGAGLVYLGVPESVYAILASKLDEAIVFPLPETADGSISRAALPEIKARLAVCNALLVGPGLSRNAETAEVIRGLVSSAAVPTVLDADGITACASEPGCLKAGKAPLILTPHDGEYARLRGGSGLSRLEDTRTLAAELGCIILRKGYRTIVTDGTEAYINTTGNPGMAAGGSGDVLAGIIVSMLGQGVPALEAAAAAAWLHGAAGDLAAEEIGEYGLLPGDLISRLPRFLY